MYETFVPFDATADEIADMSVIREGLPASLKPAVLSWIFDRLPLLEYGRGRVDSDKLQWIQSSLRVDFGWGPKESPMKADVIRTIEKKGERVVIQVVDLLASEFTSRYGAQKVIENLNYHFYAASSAFELYASDSYVFRVRRRLPEGVEKIVQEAVTLLPTAGKHLAQAWTHAFALEPNPSFAMTEAIRAVEAASGPVVTPKDERATLGKVVRVLADQSGWTLVLGNREGFPDHLQVLVGMIETLAKAQPDRHAGESPSVLEAQAHVQLAATLVHWFASGAVVRETN